MHSVWALAALLIAVSYPFSAALEEKPGHTTTYLLLDSRDHAYLLPSDTALPVSSPPSSVVAALIGAIPPQPVSSSGSDEISSIVRPNAFKKPKAHAAFTIAGLTSEELNSQSSYLFAGRRGSVPIQTQTDDHPADHMLSLHHQLAAANPGIPVTLLEQALTKTCEGHCKDQVHAMAADIFGASKSSPAILPLGALLASRGDCWATVQGTWRATSPKPPCSPATLDPPDAPPPPSLDLDALGSPVLRAELAGLHKGVLDLVQEYGKGDEDRGTHVLGMALLGLQDVQAKYGPASPQATNAKEAVRLALRWAVEQLDAALQGDITYQVAAVQALPVPSTEVLAEWKANALTRILQASTPVGNSPWYKDDEAAKSRSFSTKAAGYGSFILILYFLLGATLFLCTMRNQKDTLLYGNKKSE